MKVAVDVCIGPDGVHLLRWAGHVVVVQARRGEPDRAWFKRAVAAGAEVVISSDVDLEILAYDAAIKCHRTARGDSEVVTITRFLTRYGLAWEAKGAA